MPWLSLRVPAWLLANLCISTSVYAELRTLTDQLGRTVQADVIAVEADSIKIKRADGNIFDLPLANLSDDDQRALKEWARQNPPADKKPDAPKPLPAGSIKASLTRKRFDVDVVYKSASWSDAYEEWGYTILVQNTTLHPIANLRFEYNVLGRTHAGEVTRVSTGGGPIEPIPGKATASLPTSTIRVYKSRSTETNIRSGGELRGGWIRVYAGTTLVAEASNPESLKAVEKWTPLTRE